MESKGESVLSAVSCTIRHSRDPRMLSETAPTHFSAVAKKSLSLSIYFFESVSFTISKPGPRKKVEIQIHRSTSAHAWTQARLLFTSSSMDFCLAMSNVQRTHCNGLWELGKVLNPAMGSLFVYCIMDRFVPKHPMGLDNLPPSAIVYVVHLCVCARAHACLCVCVRSCQPARRLPFASLHASVSALRQACWCVRRPESKALRKKAVIWNDISLSGALVRHTATRRGTHRGTKPFTSVMLHQGTPREHNV